MATSWLLRQWGARARRFYIRDFKRNNPRVKVDVIKRSQLRTKLGNDFRKYYGRCSRFRAALDKEVLCARRSSSCPTRTLTLTPTVI